MAEKVIELKEISKRFGEEMVLKPLTLSFEKGKIYGLVGRNGSGKTVLLKLICGFLKPDTGTITINGAILGRKQEFPEDVGILIEKPGFLPQKNGFQALKYLAAIQGKVDDQRIREVLRMVGLEDAERKPVGKYSMGMRQRLGIAQAILETPSILLLDEPMNGLDDQGANEIRNLLKQLRDENRTIILASHIKEDIQELCDVVYHIDAGVLSESTIRQ